MRLYFSTYDIFRILKNTFFISESSNGEIPTISTLSSKSGSFLTVASPRSSLHLLWKDNIVVFVEHTTETSTMNGPRKTEKPWLTVQPQWSKNTSGINFCFDKWTYCCFFFVKTYKCNECLKIISHLKERLSWKIKITLLKIIITLH